MPVHPAQDGHGCPTYPERRSSKMTRDIGLQMAPMLPLHIGREKYSRDGYHPWPQYSCRGRQARHDGACSGGRLRLPCSLARGEE